MHSPFFIRSITTSSGKYSIFILSFPFDILTYCSYDYRDAHYFLAYTPTVQTGYSDKPLLVNFPEVDSALIKKLIEEHGFGQDVTPSWAIVSLYG